MNILVVEDEIPLSDSLIPIFEKNNYIVACTDNYEYGLYMAQTDIYDIIVLDNSIPKLNEITLLKSIRKSGLATPIIVIASEGDISYKVKVLDSGADDYLVKPFIIDELLARIRALSRRSTLISADALSFGDITLNTSNLKLSTKEAEVKLTCRECKLLELLILRKGMISSKDRILDKIWGFDSNAQANHVEVYISFLRKKLNFIKSRVVINTLRGLGYEIIEKTPFPN